jgi:hypothetical protein
MSPNSVVTTFRLEPGTGVAQTEPRASARVTLDSPALDVMTDLTRVKAATTHPATLLRLAEQAMIYLGVRMLFVVTEMPAIEGLITHTDLHGDRAMRVVAERNGHYNDLCVADVMTPLAALDAIDYDRLATARVAQLVATLQYLGRNHMLVAEAARESSPARVRGVISRAQIERQLGVSVEVAPIASIFAEINRALS